MSLRWLAVLLLRDLLNSAYQLQVLLNGRALTAWRKATVVVGSQMLKLPDLPGEETTPQLDYKLGPLAEVVGLSFELRDRTVFSVELGRSRVSKGPTF